MPLKRELGLFNTTLYGIGVIIGAGIYSLIGEGAAEAGNMLWLSFVISAIIAILTAFSYMELCSMFPKEAAEYNYTRKAFKRESLSFLIGWLLAVGTMVAASTVALGFGGYFITLFGGDRAQVAAGLILLMTALNYIGIKVSAIVNDFAASIEVLGLLVVIAIGLIFPPVLDVNLFELPSTGFTGILTAISVIFFAYIGFENVANLAEEVKDSRRVVPLALILALAISTLLYILVSLVALNQVGWEALSSSDAPLMLVVSRALGPYAVVLSLIALVSTANTVLIFLIVASRMVYGISAGGSLPKLFSVVGFRGTPYVAVCITGAVALVAASLFDMGSVAQLANVSIFIAYAAVNASVLALAKSKEPRGFTSPRLFGFPILALLGLVSSVAMLLYIKADLLLPVVLILVAGAAFFIMNKLNQTKKRVVRG